MVKTKLATLALFFFWVYGSQAQQPYTSISDALQSTSPLHGRSGPRSGNWINGGDQYSFIAGDEIHTFDPKTQMEKTVFSKSGLTFPGTSQPFDYLSFQWSKDSRHLVFRNNFRHIYRRSGISDYYIYDVDSRGLK